ncbi:MAG: hypothetical protein IIC73_07035 [Armatimonadetes bacterium]|nr:hypothetical protein [Armatimonadota bacterium]
MEKTATDWRELESRVFMQTGKRQPLVLVRGEGSRVWDDDGKKPLFAIQPSDAEFSGSPPRAPGPAQHNGLATTRPRLM